MTLIPRQSGLVTVARFGYRPELDGVRGIAIALVLGAHGATLLPDVGWARLYTGFIGVDLFFVLSGFLITTLLLEERTRTHAVSMARFYGRRAARLFPVLLFGIVIAAFAAALLGRNGPGMPFHQAALWVIACIANWSDTSLGLLAHTWALGVEEQYYLVWPVLLIVGVERKVSLRAIGWALVAGAVAISLVRVGVLYGGGSTQLVWGVLRADAVMLGSALGVMLAADRGRFRAFLTDRRVVATAAIVLALYVVYVEIGGRSGRAALTKDLLIVGTGAMTVLLGYVVSRPMPARKWLGGRLAAFGRLSYVVFLVHYPVFGVLARVGPRDPLARTTVALVVTFGLAVALHRLVERPALQLKDKVFGARTNRTVRSSGSPREGAYLIARAFGGDATPAFRFKGADVNRNS